MGREPINAWVPLFIHPQHWKLVFPQLKVPSRKNEPRIAAAAVGGEKERKRGKNESDAGIQRRARLTDGGGRGGRRG
jgi:hypothetical protein